MVIKRSRLGGAAKTGKSLRRKRAWSHVELLETRWVMAAPTLGALTDVTVVAGAPLNIALDGFDADGDTLQFSASVTSNNGNVSTYIPAGNKSLRLHVIQEDAQGAQIQDFGIMEFQLFDDLTPVTTARIEQLVNQGFYDDLTFHRIIKNFMIQGGDPQGTGSGGTGVDINDEFDATLRFTSSGLLAMAKSSDDTADSQFFITAGPTRWLDFQHTIFGMLTNGESVRNALNNVTTGTGDKPTNNVVIDSASIFTDTENGVLRLSAPIGATGTSIVTVTVSDGHGGTATRSFNVTVVADAAANNGNPFLAPISDVNMTVGQTINKTVTATDVEGNTINFYAQTVGTGSSFVWNAGTGSNVNIPPTGQTASTTIAITATTPGKKDFYFAVRPSTYTSFDQSVIDVQKISLNVAPAAPTSLDLLDASDDGASSTDNFTTRDNSAAGKSLQFKVSGVWQGSTVQLKIGDRVIGTATVPAAASGATPTLTDVIITTNATEVLSAGANTITAVQSVDGLASGFSTALNVFVNSPTTLPPIANKTLNEHETLSFSAAATDVDSPSRETLTYSLGAGFPAGAAINPTTGQFQWTPSEAQGGQTYPIVVNVLNGFGQTLTQSFSVTVNKVNESPVLTVPSSLSVKAGETLSHDFVANDGDLPADALKYKLGDGHPPEASITESGHLVFSPALSHAAGVVTFNVIVEDGHGGTDTKQVSITINNPPIINSIGDQVVTEGSPLLLTVTTVQETLGIHVLYRLADGAPQGIDFDDHGGFIWNTTEADGRAEPYSITVIARHDNGEESSQTFHVTVTDVNEPPVLAEVADRNINEGDLLSIQMAATDPDVPANVLTYHLDSGPSGATINPSSGLLTWNSTENDGGHDYTFVVRVTDAGGLSDTIQFKTTVNEVNRNPSITPPQSTLSVKAGETLEYQFTATDPDLPANTLTFSLPEDHPAGVSITADGKLTFVSTQAPPNTSEINVTVLVSDGQTGQASLVVPIRIGNLPVFDPINNVTVDEGEFALFTAVARTNNLSDHMVYRLADGAPAGAFVDAHSGAFVWQTGEANGGQTYTVTVIATNDLGLESSINVQVTVNDFNRAPTLNQPQPITIAAGETANYTFTATDPDLPVDTLTYSLAAGFPEGASITPQGVFQFVTTSAHYTETLNITVLVDDGHGGTDSKVLTINVQQQPIFDPIGNQEVQEGDTVLFTAAAHTTEPLNHFTYRLGDGAPAGAFMDEDSGAFIWKTTEADGPGVYSITVIARDSHNLEVSQTIQITVGEQNVAPTIASVDPQTVTQGQLLQVQIAGSDADLPAQQLTYALGDGAPAGVTIDPATGLLAWTPSTDVAPGTYSISVKVTDSDGLEALEVFDVTVIASGLTPAEAQAIANSAAFPGAAAEFAAIVSGGPGSVVNTFNAFNGLPPAVNTIGQGLGTGTPGTLPFTEMIAPNNLDTSFFFRSFDSVNHLGADTGVGTHWTSNARTTNRPTTPPEGENQGGPAGPSAANPGENRNAKGLGKSGNDPSESASNDVEDAHDAAMAALVSTAGDLAIDAMLSEGEDAMSSEDASHGPIWTAIRPTGARIDTLPVSSRESEEQSPLNNQGSGDTQSTHDSKSADNAQSQLTAAALSAMLLTPLVGKEASRDEALRSRHTLHVDARWNRRPR